MKEDMNELLSKWLESSLRLRNSWGMGLGEVRIAISK